MTNKIKIETCCYCENGRIAKYWRHGAPDFYVTGSWGERDPMKWFDRDKCKGKGKLTYIKKTVSEWVPIYE